MNLSDLLSSDRLKKTAPDAAQAKECLLASERDIGVARKILPEDSDWAFSISYNAMLQSARALMFADGFAPSRDDSHKTAIDYSDVKLGTKFSDKIALFDNMRKKRHRAIYEKAGEISPYEARQAIQTAEDFLQKVKEKLKL